MLVKALPRHADWFNNAKANANAETYDFVPTFGRQRVRGFRLSSDSKHVREAVGGGATVER